MKRYLPDGPNRLVCTAKEGDTKVSIQAFRIGAFSFPEAAEGGIEDVATCSERTDMVERRMRALRALVMHSGALVVIVDDDESVRESLPDLLRQLGYGAQAFASAEELLASDAVLKAKCLILDIGLPGMSGPDLQRELLRRGYATPAIFITGRSNRSIPPDLLEKAGIACLFKPFSEQDLQAALDVALQEGG
jgi:CheY-like chemotaxis protein